MMLVVVLGTTMVVSSCSKDKDDDNNSSLTVHGGNREGDKNSDSSSKTPGGLLAVDLGLSVKWAPCNIGANAPEEYGDYFAWGDPVPYYKPLHSQDNPCSSWNSGKTGYGWGNYKWCEGTDRTMTKYCTSRLFGIVDNKKTLDLEDDAAHFNWGGAWRMPTNAELEELYRNCTWEWTQMNGVTGVIIRSKKNSNYIFLPAAGYRSFVYLKSTGSAGDYLTSSVVQGEDYYAFGFYFNATYWRMCTSYRDTGRSVRAVCP